MSGNVWEYLRLSGNIWECLGISENGCQIAEYLSAIFWRTKVFLSGQVIWWSTLCSAEPWASKVLDVKSSEHQKHSLPKANFCTERIFFCENTIIKKQIYFKLPAFCKLLVRAVCTQCIWTAVAFKVWDLRSASAGTLGPGGCTSEHKGEVNSEVSRRGILLPLLPPIRPVGGLWRHYTSWWIALMVLGGRLHGGRQVSLTTYMLPPSDIVRWTLDASMTSGPTRP